MIDQLARRVGGDALDVRAAYAVELFDKPLSEGGDVLAPVAERRQADGPVGVEPVEQILAEPAGAMFAVISAETTTGPAALASRTIS